MYWQLQKPMELIKAKSNSRPGNSTYAGATAAIMANVVLIAYVFAAMREDQEEQGKEGKKDR
jgi:hypothetical protein